MLLWKALSESKKAFLKMYIIAAKFPVIAGFKGSN